MNKKHVIYLICVLFVVVTGIVYFLNNYDSDDEILLEDVMQESAIIEDEEDNVYDLDDSSDSSIELDDESKQDDSSDKDGYIYVHICGAVNKPGVYEMCANSRVIDIIDKAGGLRKDADNAIVNQAKILEDCEQIYIPYEGEQVNINSSTSNNINVVAESKQDAQDKININTASKNELITLPGIGEAKADMILEYRSENGSFSKIEDIMNITGIKEGLFNKISEYITV